MINVQLFGDFRVQLSGEDIALPASKKTRALLAYLIVTSRPQRRDRLCEIFWDTPNDPKAALRWSLSKLRKLLDDTSDLIEADRERVRMNTAKIETELTQLDACLSTPDVDKAKLDEILETLSREFLAGVDIPNLPEYTEWLRAERENIKDMQADVLTLYLDLPGLSPSEQINMATQGLAIRPFDGPTANRLIQTYKALNKNEEANDWEAKLTARFREAGVELKLEPAETEPVASPVKKERELLSQQKIKFCKTPSGVNLAYASVGEGPPLIKAANWLSHLELDWSAPIWSPIYKRLAQDFQFIRYDERGNGLSDWKVNQISQDVFVRDLETVVDHLGLDKFPLLGISQGAAVSIDYAVKYPEKVTKMILFGGYPKGWRIDATDEVRAVREAMMTLTKTGWGTENPAYRHIFSSTFMPTATSAQLSWFDEFQRQTTSPENAVRFLEAFADIDVRHQLSKIQTPTLVIHSKGDQRIDWTVGRDIAAAIPNAEFVILDSDNHLLLEGEPAADKFISVVKEFLLD